MNQPTPPHKLCPQCGNAAEVAAALCVRCGHPFRTPPPANRTQFFAPGGLPVLVQPRRSRPIAAIWAFVLGGIGAHRFYLGQHLLGAVYLLFCWTFIPAVVSLIDGVVLLMMSDFTFDTLYNRD